MREIIVTVGKDLYDEDHREELDDERRAFEASPLIQLLRHEYLRCVP